MLDLLLELLVTLGGEDHFLHNGLLTPAEKPDAGVRRAAGNRSDG
jgi:hypothetical protein